MKKIIILTVIMLCVFGVIASLSGDLSAGIGDKYKSVYSSKGLEVTEYDGKDQHCLSFDSLNGNYVCRFKKTTDGNGEINYTAFVRAGELKIYYDSAGNKELLAIITPGETIINAGGTVHQNKSVYIIIEATDALDGYVYINL